MSRYRLIFIVSVKKWHYHNHKTWLQVRSGLGRSGRKSVGANFAAGLPFELLDFHFSFHQPALASLRQASAFLVFGQKRFQRQIVVFHCIDNPLQPLERFFKWQIDTIIRRRSCVLHRFRHPRKLIEPRRMSSLFPLQYLAAFPIGNSRKQLAANSTLATLFP